MNRRAFVAAVTTALLLTPGVALAAFQRTTTAQSMVLSTLTVSPVTSLGATASCGPPLSLSAKVVLTWTGTPTARATSYEIRRRILPGVATAVGTAAIGASSYTDSTLPVGISYGYVVRTYVGGWYADSAEVQVTTPAVCT